jgi:general secretion pathway protein C
MGLDAIIKRYFPIIVCLLIGICAYFQARGFSQILAASVVADPEPPPPSALAPKNPAAAANTPHAASAETILSRNVFDSVTGPLDGKDLDLPKAPVEMATGDPYLDPPCSATRVGLIMVSDDPSWSFASIAVGGGQSILRRQGDAVDGPVVHAIAWDRVWLTRDGTRCQAELGGPPPGAAPPAPARGPAPAAKRGGVPEEIASKIQKVSETEFTVERSAVTAILANQSELMKARITPEKEGDKVVGIRLGSIRPGSLLSTLGLQNGDRLSTVNGFDITDPQKALEAYSQLQRANRLTVSVTRGGKPMTLDFNIK